MDDKFLRKNKNCFSVSLWPCAHQDETWLTAATAASTALTEPTLPRARTLSMGTYPTALTEPALPGARTLSTGDSTMP